MEFTQSSSGSGRAEVHIPIAALVHSSLRRALSGSSAGEKVAEADSDCPMECDAIAELMVDDATFLKEIRFITMLAFEQTPESLREAIRQLGNQRMQNVVVTCILLDRLRKQKDAQWCLHRALFLADVCWAVSRLHKIGESEQVYIMRLLQSLGYLAPGWEKRVFGGDQLSRLMMVSEMAACYIPAPGESISPIGSMHASHEWLAKLELDEFLDSLAVK